jgi:hypothetical protein
MSHSQSNGARVNQWGHSVNSGGTVVLEGGVVRSKGRRPSHVDVSRRDQWGGTGHASGGEGRKANGEFKTRKRTFQEKQDLGAKVHTKRSAQGMVDQAYLPPVLANPGNVIHCKVGGGLMGHPLAHENEAPFPLSLAEFFVLSFCPPEGTVLDPFIGSGTTAHAAQANARHCIGIDARRDMIDLSHRRISSVTKPVGVLDD